MNRELGCAALPAPVPGLPLPVQEERRGDVVLPLPPWHAVGGHGHVREDRVARDRGECVRVGLRPGAGHDAEEAGLRVHRPEPAVGAGPQPGDVVAHRAHLVAAAFERRDQHGEVRLAAGRGEGRADVVDLPVGQLELEDEHVLGHPALVAGHGRGDAQREALLAQEGVAAVARAHAPDRALLREVHDEAPLRREVPERVEARHELLGRAQLVEGGPAHAGHEPHVRDDVGAVRDLDPDPAEGRAERAHDVGHDVERPSLHRALEERPHPLPGLRGRHPVVRGPGVLARPAGDEGEVLGAGHVRGVAAVQVRAGGLLRVEPAEGAVGEHLVDEPGVLRLGPVAPRDPVRPEGRRHLLDPALDWPHASFLGPILSFAAELDRSRARLL